MSTMVNESFTIPLFNDETNSSSTTPATDTEKTDSLATALENISIILSVFGFLANLGTLITLLKHGKDFSAKSKLLLQNQVNILKSYCVLCHRTNIALIN